MCNLLYQLLGQDKEGAWIAVLFSQNPSLGEKEADSNWSERELREAILKVFHMVPASDQICMFLDGLDEVYQAEGKHDLLSLLRWLEADTRVRMCVSSRPEAEFKRELSSSPTLQLYDLTAPDMYQYAFHLLKPLTKSLPDDVSSQEKYSRVYKKYFVPTSCQNLAHTIVEKSDGVFLWADIACRSLQRGVANEDTWSQIEFRLNKMPKDLSKLYASMWLRLGDDAAVYAAEAALCFNLVLDWEIYSTFSHYNCWNPDHVERNKDGDFRCRSLWAGLSDDGCSILQLALAKKGVVTNKDLQQFESTADLLWDECCGLYRQLPVLSAGLLEFSGPLLQIPDTGYEVRNLSIEVRFVHRTAREFFTDAPEGREILNFDTSSFAQRFRASLRAIFSRGLAFRQSTLEERKFFCLPFTYINAHRLSWRFRDMRSRLEKSQWFEELDTLMEFHDHNVGVHTRSIFYPQRDFLALAMNSCLEDYLQHSLTDLYQYTQSYKNYLLAYASFVMDRPGQHYSGENWTIKDWKAWLEIINYLLTHGCRSEAVIVHVWKPYKVTGLEAFILNLSVMLRDKELDEGLDESLSDCVMEAFRNFARCGADFTQPIYRFYEAGSLSVFGDDDYFSLTEPRLFFCQGDNPVPFRGKLFIRWPILGILARAASMHLQKNKYFRHRLEEFVISLKLDEILLQPKVIAINPQDGGRQHYSQTPAWTLKAKRVSRGDEKRIMDNITKFVPWDSDDWDAKVRQLGEELESVIESILDNDKELEDISDYLFVELGLGESWPIALRTELAKCGYTFRTTLREADNQKEEEEWKRKLPGGSAIPVKFLHQLDAKERLRESPIEEIA